eukprot:TRINITY_DN3319_c0_g2_i1.p1 TRINITY_DN3319_c0_g2~~TRINITY_DN3319_c0_g2_i1.p1  ORF type:complete len:262 (+),score=-2.82 TRINITY_DN3319_c0_g2_i1:33-818(+)
MISFRLDFKGCEQFIYCLSFDDLYAYIYIKLLTCTCCTCQTGSTVAEFEQKQEWKQLNQGSNNDESSQQRIFQFFKCLLNYILFVRFGFKLGRNFWGQKNKNCYKNKQSENRNFTITTHIFRWCKKNMRCQMGKVKNQKIRKGKQQFLWETIEPSKVLPCFPYQKTNSQLKTFQDRILSTLQNKMYQFLCIFNTFCFQQGKHGSLQIVIFLQFKKILNNLNIGKNQNDRLKVSGNFQICEIASNNGKKNVHPPVQVEEFYF